MNRHESQRGYFAHELHEQMATNSDIWLITGDLGYAMLDGIREDFPDRFINAGAAEQAMMGVAVGLAMEGKKPFVYSITPFLLYRPFETIRNYINHEQIPVRLVGGGRRKDYEHDGFSHWADDVPLLFNHFDSPGVFNRVKAMYPDCKEQVPGMVRRMVKEDRPWFLSLRR